MLVPGRDPRVPRAVMASLALVLLVGAPAAAHPFFQGGAAPVDSLTTLTLDLAHGCASESAGGGADTLEVALEVPEWLRVVEVPTPAGWRVELERDAGEVAVVSWAAAGAREPAPVFTFDAVIDGEPGEERHLAVFQSCEDRVHRWIGTPETPADEPAVRLQLTAADPDRPPPAADPSASGAGGTPAAAPDPADAPPDGEPPAEAVDEGADGAAAEGADEGAAEAAGAVGTIAAQDDAAFPWWPTLAAVVLVGGALLWLMRLRRSAT